MKKNNYDGICDSRKVYRNDVILLRHLGFIIIVCKQGTRLILIRMKLFSSEWSIFISAVVLFVLFLGLMVYANVACLLCNMQCSSRTGNVILSLIFLLLGVIQIIVFVNVKKHKLEGKRFIFTDNERQIKPPTKPEVNIGLKSLLGCHTSCIMFTNFLTNYAVLFPVKKG